MIISTILWIGIALVNHYFLEGNTDIPILTGIIFTVFGCAELSIYGALLLE